MNNRKLIGPYRTGIICMCLVLFNSSLSAAEELNGAEIYIKAKAASVEVLVGGRQDGSGWFADKNGLVVTAAHAIWNRKKAIEIISPVAGRLPAKVIAIDRGHDIALLQVPDSKGPYPFLSVETKPPAPGEEVYLFGAAFFRHHVMIRGTMARDSSTFEYLSDQQCYTEVYHISAPSPPGTSGGCWLNREGKVIGNQSAFLSKDGVGMGIAMASSPDAIDRLVRIKKSVATPTLGSGLEELPSQPPDFISRFPSNSFGLVPVLPVKGGPAKKADLVGDKLITEIDHQPVQSRDHLLRIIRSKKSGDKVTFTVLLPDDPSAKTIEVTLGSLISQ